VAEVAAVPAEQKIRGDRKVAAPFGKQKKIQISKFYETIAGLALILLSIIFYRFPQTYLLADILAVLAAVICGRELVVGAIFGLLKGKLNVDELITVAIIASFVLGQYLVAAEVAFIMTVGGYLEERIIEQSRKAIDELAALMPGQARLKGSGGEKMVPLEHIQRGDLVLVKPGEEIPVDGVVLRGSALVSEAKITGESKPGVKKPGDTVWAGSISFDGGLEIKALKAGKKSVLARLVELTQQALEEKTPAIRLADRFAAWFTPLVLSLTFLVYVLSGDIYRAITVLVVVCPCTLVLAIPSALVASLGKAVKNGILPKGGVYLEKAAETEALILDKTGTLTFGSPKITSIITFAGVSEEYLLTVAGVAEKHSNHPIAREILAEGARRGLKIPDPKESSIIPGRGMLARLNGQEIAVGSLGLFRAAGVDYGNLQQALKIGAEEEKMGRTSFFVAVGGEIIGVISLEDVLREEALQSISFLRKMIPRLILLTGDNYQTAYQAARETGISEFRAHLLPEDKVKLLKELKKGNKTVAAVGDGINDAPLLAAADVGIVMGDSAAAVTLNAGSVILVNGDLAKVPLFFKIARDTKRIIRQNIIVFAIIYNLISFYLAAAGYLTPLGGAIVHNIGSTMVVLNSMRLLK